MALQHARFKMQSDKMNPVGLITVLLFNKNINPLKKLK